MTLAYVGLGANLGDREGSIRLASELIGARRLSTLRETEPWGVPDQPCFVNAVAELETAQTAHALLERLLTVERQLGRVRDGTRWGPRTIDLDLLVFGDESTTSRGSRFPTGSSPGGSSCSSRSPNWHPTSSSPGSGRSRSC